MQGTVSFAVHRDASGAAAAASSDSLMDAASTAVHRDTGDPTNSDAMIGIAGIALADASTAVCKDAADPSSSADTCLVGIAGDALYPARHAAANPYMACVREDPTLACVHEGLQPRRGRAQKTKLMLAAVAAMIIVAGLALGLGLGLGLHKGGCL